MAKFERVLTVLWVGGLWSIGYIVAPVLFAMLPRAQAGDVAGRLFGIIGYVGLAVAIVLAWRAWQAQQRAMTAILGVMWACIAIGQFIVQPWMTELKAQGLLPMSDAAHQFGVLHGVSSALYLLTSVLALVYVIMRKADVPYGQSA